MALLAIAMVIALVVIVGEGMIHRDPKAQPVSSERLASPPTPAEPAALVVLEAFFEAANLAAKAEFVRDGARVKPLMMDYHERRGHSFPTLGRVSQGKSASFDGTQMVLFEVEPFSGPRYPVAVVWDGQRFAVDWESLTAYGSMDWSEFIETKPAATQTLRVFVHRVSEAAQIPGLPAGYVSFSMEHRDDSQSLTAVAGPSMSALLQPLVRNGRTPVTLEVVWKPLALGGTPIVEILRLVSLKWSP